MTDSVIGTARLDIVVGTEGVDAGKAKVVAASKEMSRAVEASSGSMEKASKRQQDATRRSVELFGKSKEEVTRWQIAQRFGAEEAAKLNAKLDIQVAKLNQGAAAFNKYGVTAKQQAAALRGVPAQVTDIFTSLASGQRPITVLLQQGGQLKDMFGGIVPAARALGSAVLGLINPLTVFGGLAAGLFIAFKQGDDEMVHFNQALALTGNTAGVTANELQAMAQAMALGNTTQHEAAAALAEVTKSGKFTADQIRDVADAAVAMERATGQAVEQTVAQFAKLKDDPVKAVQELNDKYHFLTAAVYEQIRALQAQGREEDAVNLAISESSKALKKRADDVVANAGFMERAWRNLGSVVRQVWDDIRDAGRASSAVGDAQMKIASARSQLYANASLLRKNGAGMSPQDLAEFKRSNAVLIKQIQGAQKTIANDPGARNAQQAAARQRANDLAISLRSESDQYLSAAEKLQAQRVKKEGEIAAAVAAARAAGDKKLEEQAKASGQKILDGIDKQIKDNQSRAESSGGGRARSGGSSRAASAPARRELPDINSAAAAQELQRLAQAESQANEQFLDLQATLQGPLAVAMREHEQNVARLNALAAQSPVAQAGLNEALRLEEERHKANVKAIEAQLDPMSQLLDDMKFELDMIGKSNAERAVMIELRRQNKDAMSDEGQAAIETAKMFEKEAEAKQRSIALMDDFRRGASDALADIITGAKSAKDAFNDFFNDLFRQATKAITDRLIERAFGSFGSNSGGAVGGNWFSALAGLFANANGNAFNGGQVMAFANGGVFDRPTAFGMSGGRLGVMGEAGPEAVMPLRRGPDGKLGVMASAVQRVVQQVTHIHVQGAPDRRTLEQIDRANGRRARRGMGRTG